MTAVGKGAENIFLGGKDQFVLKRTQASNKER